MLIVQERASGTRSLLQRIVEARRYSDSLFEIVRPEFLYERPIPERHRIVFYIGHLEAFDWNLLSDRAFHLKTFDPQFDRLFAFGIDPVGGGLPSDQPSDWPAIEAVRQYVRETRVALDEKLTAAQTDDGDPELTKLLNVAIEHRLMHLETLAYMLHQLPLRQKILHRDSPTLAIASPVHRMIPVPAGRTTLGLDRSGTEFGWDNEYERHSEFVPGFHIDQYMVTNQQYLDFISDGGYEARELWSDTDWNWKTESKISHPVFWKRSGDQWMYRTMFEEVPLPLPWPVYVSHAEASAFCRWAGKSLPTEPEWHRAAYATTDGSERFYPWGEEPPSSRLGNFDFLNWDPVQVNAFAEGKSAFGVEGMLGNGWEWTSTQFAPFAGFEKFPFYPGYSADFFDGKHFVIKGGSARTAACMLRPTFRNWFQSHYQYVYAGFRCVRRES